MIKERGARPVAAERAQKTAPAVSVKARSERIYLASSVSTYRTLRYETLRIAVKRLYPGAEIVEPRKLFGSTEHWRVEWDTVLATIDRLIFFADEDGCIGAGVYQEILDARLAQIRIAYLANTKRLVPIDQVWLQLVGDECDRKQFARVKIAAAISRKAAA